jgi:hypothetical protein
VRDALSKRRGFAKFSIGMDQIEIAGKAGKTDNVMLGNGASNGTDFLPGLEIFEEQTGIQG